jgi:hypothetical protein
MIAYYGVVAVSITGSPESATPLLLRSAKNVRVATLELVSDISVIDSVQLVLGQSGAPGIGVVGGAVLTVMVRFPFLMSLPGMATLPDTSDGAGFCPGTLD